MTVNPPSSRGKVTQTTNLKFRRAVRLTDKHHRIYTASSEATYDRPIRLCVRISHPSCGDRPLHQAGEGVSKERHSPGACGVPRAEERHTRGRAAAPQHARLRGGAETEMLPEGEGPAGLHRPGPPGRDAGPSSAPARPRPPPTSVTMSCR